MSRYVYRPNHPDADEFGTVDVDLIGSDYEASSAPGVISDNMDMTRHMADGRHYDSKSEFRRATKRAGCVEVGTDTSISRPRKPIQLDRGSRRESIKRAIYELKNGSNR